MQNNAAGRELARKILTCKGRTHGIAHGSDGAQSLPWSWGVREEQTVDALMKLELPAGVDVEIKASGKEHK